MGYLIDILIGAASRIVTGELTAHVEPFSRWVINKSAEHLPVEVRDRFREEWLAHMDETPGTMCKLWHAIGCRLGASKIGNVLRQQRKQSATFDKRIVELSRNFKAIMGETKFEQMIKVAIDAAADVEGRRSDHEVVVTAVIEQFRWQTHEPWGGRLYRRWRVMWRLYRGQPFLEP